MLQEVFAASAHVAGSVTGSLPVYTNSLSITSAPSSDDKFYRCKVVTSLYTVHSSKRSLSVLGYVSALSSKTLVSGNDLSLTCTFDNPDAFSGTKTITWYKGQSLISDNNKITTDLNTKPGSTTLHVSGVVYGDGGSYSCRITYENVGSLNSQADVIVREVTTNPASVEEFITYTVTLTCAIRAANPGGMGRCITPPPPIFNLHPPNNFDFS